MNRTSQEGREWQQKQAQTTQWHVALLGPTGTFFFCFYLFLSNWYMYEFIAATSMMLEGGGVDDGEVGPNDMTVMTCRIVWTYRYVPFLFYLFY